MKQKIYTMFTLFVEKVVPIKTSSRLSRNFFAIQEAIYSYDDTKMLICLKKRKKLLKKFRKETKKSIRTYTKDRKYEKVLKKAISERIDTQITDIDIFFEQYSKSSEESFLDEIRAYWSSITVYNDELKILYITNDFQVPLYVLSRKDFAGIFSGSRYVIQKDARYVRFLFVVFF